MTRPSYRVAVLLPCYNEAPTIARVVRDFRQALPDAMIYVCDNNSTDDSVARARAAGAVVLREPLQGKGNVVRRMFADIEADIYVLADADATYDAASAPALLQRLVDNQLDFVNARRIARGDLAYRPGHRLGNRLLSALVASIFGNRIGDMLSGYKVLSRRFVKSFPALASGFETETELAVHALELRMPLAEVETPYFDRPEDSPSKLNTWTDGARILFMIGLLIKEERPLAFFSVLFAMLVIASLSLGLPVIWEFLETGFVPRLPTAILATGIMLLAFIALVCGLVLDTVTHGRREIKRLHYLAVPAVGQPHLTAADMPVEPAPLPNGA